MSLTPFRSASGFALVLAAALAFAAPALAQTGEQKEAADFSVSGVVKAVDAEQRTITIQGPNDDGGSYDVDPKAMLKNGDTAIGLADLKLGWGVTGNGDQRDGKNVLTYLETTETP